MGICNPPGRDGSVLLGEKDLRGRWPSGQDATCPRMSGSTGLWIGSPTSYSPKKAGRGRREGVGGEESGAGETGSCRQTPTGKA